MITLVPASIAAHKPRSRADFIRELQRERELLLFQGHRSTRLSDDGEIVPNDACSECRRIAEIGRQLELLR
jgi:hypothetical protein